MVSQWVLEEESFRACMGLIHLDGWLFFVLLLILVNFSIAAD